LNAKKAVEQILERVNDVIILGVSYNKRLVYQKLRTYNQINVLTLNTQ